MTNACYGRSTQFSFSPHLFADTLYSFSSAAQSYHPSIAGFFVTSTHSESSTSTDHSEFSPTPQMQLTTNKEFASPSQIQSHFVSPRTISSTWYSTLYEELTSSTGSVPPSFQSQDISSSVAPGSTNASVDASEETEEKDMLTFIISGTFGAVIFCVLVAVLAFLIIQRRRRDS